MNNNQWNNKFSALSRAGVVIATLLLLALILASCGSGGGAAETAAVEAETAVPPVETEDAAVSDEESAEAPMRIENGDGPPFYARFGENEFFSDGEHVVIIFYRQPDCIPADFNLNQFFHFPGEDGPGAFGCAPPTVATIETWQNGPETDPAPLVAETTGLGAVPVWFFAAQEVEAAMADGVVTIGELADLPSRQMGTASTYTELLHPSQSNDVSLVQFSAQGDMDDGGSLSVDVSKGDPQVDDHININISG